MSYLINRNPAGRLICLHSLARYLAARFGDKEFYLKDLKYDANSKHNIHNHCPLLIKLPSVAFPVCPYLENPLSLAKCYLTQSLQEDTQKSKSASDAFNALEGLGFIDRIGRTGKLTKSGHEFADCDYYASHMYNILRRRVLGYGPFYGLLFQINRHSGDSTLVKRGDIFLGYPETDEIIQIGGRNIRLSTASRDDTITRTRSALLTWAITTGFILPKGFPKPLSQTNWHVHTLPYIRKERWTSTQFHTFLSNDLFTTKHRIERPLEYDAMTKSTQALRERNQEEQRALTLRYENIIKNRRFAISYLLGLAAEEEAGVDFDNMISALKSNINLFVIDKSRFKAVMAAELGIAFVTGIPFDMREHVLWPVSKIDLDVLSKGAPLQVRQFLDSISSDVLIRHE